MARLILAALVVAIIIGLAIAFGRVVAFAQEVPMPNTAKTISYVLLILLMLGVVTGWLGGL